MFDPGALERGGTAGGGVCRSTELMNEEEVIRKVNRNEEERIRKNC